MAVSQMRQICLLEKPSRKNRGSSEDQMLFKLNSPASSCSNIALANFSLMEAAISDWLGLNFVWKQVEAGMYYILRWLYSSLSCNKGNGKPWTLLYQLLKGFNICICNCCRRAPDISYTTIINIPIPLYFSESLSFSVLFRN